MDVLVIIAVLGGVGVAWRACADLRRIREALESIAMSQTVRTNIEYNRDR